MISGQRHAYAVVVEKRACSGGAMVVWVVGFCGFPISGFVGFDLLVIVVVVIDLRLLVLWLWVGEREMRCCGGGDCYGVVGVVVVG